jgi:hypothetical protein
LEHCCNIKRPPLFRAAFLSLPKWLELVTRGLLV